MLSFHFYLSKQKTNKAGEMPIYISISAKEIERIRKRVVDVKTIPKYWDSKNQRIKSTGNPLGKEIVDLFNADLLAISEILNQINIEVYRNKIVLTRAYIEERLSDPGLITQPGISFVDKFKEYQEVESSIRAKNTIKGRNTVLNFLVTFAEEKNIKLTLNSINLSFYDSLKTYTFSELSKTDGYFAKIISVLSAFMAWAALRGYHNNHEYKRFSATEPEGEVIVLTLDELSRLLNCKYESKILREARDMFCFACFTGLRFGDVASLTSSHVYGDELIIRVEKTKENNISIPLNKYALAIIADRKGPTLFSGLANQTVNTQLKECARIAGIDKATTKSRVSGSVITNSTRPKWELITFHVARKTFVTNSLILGMDERTIRSITGHKKEKNFQRYVKLADSFKRESMNKTWNNIKL